MQLGFIGAGNMASALARGIGEPVLVSDPDSDRAAALARAVGGEALGSNAEVAERADVVVLCHKPKQLDEVADEVGATAKAVVSILARTTQAEVREAYPATPVFRVEPNTPVELRRGVLAFAASDAGGDAVAGSTACSPVPSLRTRPSSVSRFTTRYRPVESTPSRWPISRTVIPGFSPTSRSTSSWR
jgi:pyrroline-5-carboxylate reductase